MWYLDQKAAEWLGVSVLALDDVPLYWRQRALTAISAENWAENERMAHQRAQMNNRQ